MCDKHCEDCRFFSPFYDEGDKPPLLGECRRFPPVWTGGPQESQSADEYYYWHNPVVGAYGSCGEFSKRIGELFD